MNTSATAVSVQSPDKDHIKRITLVISSLGSGGAERVMSVMANYWAKHDREVTLITLTSVQEDFYTLHPRVRRIGLGLNVNSSHVIAAIKNNLQRVKRLRHEIKTSKPDVVLSFVDTTNVLAVAATVGLGIPIIVSEHIDPRQHTIRSEWAWLRYLLYPQATAVVVLTNNVRCWAERIVKSNKIHVIPNPVTIPAEGHNGRSDFRSLRRTVVAMGRLTPQKGFDLLLAAFSVCARKYPDWSLIILGEGEERSRLEAMVLELGIANQVSLPGRIKDPTAVFWKADIFVLSSRYEGFPMALVEAMACKLAVISTDCPSGPRVIIRDGVDGVLIPPNDVDALAAAMSRLINDETERKRLALRAVEVTERFGLEKVISMWDTVIDHARKCTAKSEHAIRMLNHPDTSDLDDLRRRVQ
jgi:GalNAc-alpha-(1->4)-GalNAc-alpha-(1->3)-diNAcBac-PP-undecaprenol alpha-1,4-N-acetyl-D-galactosaminyltransferase